MPSVVAVERTIAAEPQRIFDVLADPALHPVIDGSGSVRAAHTGNPERLSLGARFGMDVKLGAPYEISNKVVEFDEGKQIGWRHFNGHVWRYILTPVDGGTRVREEWDPRPAKAPWVLSLMGFPRRNRKGMISTLDRLAEHVAG
ncbi:MAG: SRPBCC family protein [Jatrophihabitans sp.]